jgi:hypothetical protein
VPEVGTPDHAVVEAETWFVAQGLPYFVDGIRARVDHALSAPRLVVAGLTATGLAALAGIGAGLWVGSSSVGAAVAICVVLAVLGWYALSPLHGRVIVAWAGHHTLSSLGLLYPLVTRALPMLMLFVTFLFINTEVWQVAAALDGYVMLLTVLLFSVMGIGFLLARLPEELEVFDGELDADVVAAGCAGTPLAGAAASYPRGQSADDEHLHGLQRTNLILVLLIAQVVQVLLLSVSVFAFFVVFGALTMDPEVVGLWVGADGTHSLSWFPRLSRELLQVSVFLSAFSGLYFTVYAVMDGNYRTQFFTAVTDHLRRAMCARAVYRSLVQRAD